MWMLIVTFSIRSKAESFHAQDEGDGKRGKRQSVLLCSRFGRMSFNKGHDNQNWSGKNQTEKDFPLVGVET